MAGMGVKEFRAEADRGDIVIRLASLNAHPMQGVLSALGQGHVAPAERADPAILEWRLPAAAARYVVYGVITPLNRLLLAPSFERSVWQGPELLKGGPRNPERLGTRKLNAGEWVGAPEVISIKII